MNTQVALTFLLVAVGAAGHAGRAAPTGPMADQNRRAMRAHQLSELAGVTVGREGRPWPGCLVAVVPADVDPQLRSRFAQLIQADRGGRFAVRDLFAGSYLVTASPDVNPTIWLTPAFLDRLGRLSARVVLADREKKTVTLPCARLP
jgi:hypothetical protein